MKTLARLEQEMTARALKRMTPDKICELGGVQRIRRAAIMISTRKNVVVQESKGTSAVN